MKVRGHRGRKIGVVIMAALLTVLAGVLALLVLWGAAAEWCAQRKDQKRAAEAAAARQHTQARRVAVTGIIW